MKNRKLSIPGAVSAALTAMIVATALFAAPGANAAWTVKGGGFGHGIGMSAYGAYGMAEHGWSYRKILRHYYQHTRIRELVDEVERYRGAERRNALARLTKEISIHEAAEREIVHAYARHRLAGGAILLGGKRRPRGPARRCQKDQTDQHHEGQANRACY